MYWLNSPILPTLAEQGVCASSDYNCAAHCSMLHTHRLMALARLLLTWNSRRSSSTQVTSVEPPGLQVIPATIPVAGSSPARRSFCVKILPLARRN